MYRPPKESSKTLLRRNQSGQALIEYVLIIVLVVIAFSIALAATGPAISNVFSNAVYNLIAEAGTPQPDLPVRGGPTAFWLTVTWAADPANQPEERPFPTNEPPPPTDVPTEGPPPPPTNTPLPTNTPTQTPTLGPTHTPVDKGWMAPYEDPMEEPVRWRVDNSVFLGSAQWRAEFYPNTTLSGTPDFTQYLDGINLNPGDGNAVISGWRATNYSIKFTKQIYVEVPTRVNFKLSADDGVRLWLLGPGQQAGACLGGTGVSSPPTPGQSNGQTNRVFPDPATHCLLVDDWHGQSVGSTPSVTRTIPAGLYTLQVDYYQSTGTHTILLETARGGGEGSPDDDTRPAGGNPMCTWTNSETYRANTSQTAAFMWEENGNGDFPPNMICHLEFRGWVEIPAGMNQPEFTFWDVWDFGSNNTRTWVEFARHVPNSPTEGWGLDRTAGGVQWIRATPDPMRTGPGANYAWTLNRIDLAALGFGEGDKVTFRFVIENTGGGAGNRRWYIDDVAIKQSRVGTQTFTVGKFWNAEDANQKNDFIYTGRWDITANNKARGSSSWEESPSQNYVVNNEGTTRIHALELNGWVDLSGSTPDLEGDTGDPLISFYHAYNIARRSHLELQYTRDPYDAVPDVWTTVPGAGILLAPNTSSTRNQDTLIFVEVPLNEIPNYNTQPFRLRFALIVNTTNTGEVAQGWWIDEIYIERDEVDRFSNYPFLDTAETPNQWWRFDGLWGRTTNTGVFDSLAAFADTPLGNYTRGTNASMTLRYPLDLNNDTPENLALYGGNLHWASSPSNPIQGTPENTANRPVLTFWHWRDVNSNAILAVEWKRVNDPDNAWQALWQYQYGNYFDGSTRTATGTQLAWERVEVDMSGIPYNPTDAVKTDDDVYIRFRFDVRSSNARDGVYIDNILIENRSEVVWELWSTASGGSGVTLFEEFETDWFNRWYAGGDWMTESYTVHSGLQAIHESPAGQTTAPPNTGDTVTRHDTWQVLEMRTIVDLTNTPSNVGPMLQFWSRWFTGDDDRIYVQISVEDPTSTTQGYEKVRGWSRWSTVWGSGYGSSSDPNFIPAEYARNYTWVRRQISLQSYIGKRIRVRFVFDALDQDNNRDGWYLDDIYFIFREPQTIFPVGFSDPASNLNNWVAEGTWGLDPEVFYGSGGGPASLGPNAWFGYYYRCPNNDCTPTRAGTQLLDRIPRNQTDSLNAVRNPLSYYSGVPANANYDSLGIELTEVVIDVNHDFRSSGPRGSLWATNDFAGRWLREIRIQPGQFTFITISDDGVRLRVEPTSNPVYWNLINKWQDQSRSVNMATVTLGGDGFGPDGNNYNLILEYYENSSDAAIVLSAGNNNFSFTDSPKPLAGGGLSTEVPAIPRGNSSLQLDGVIDLRNLEGNPNFIPVLEYDTYYELNNDSIARVEVSTDGGFFWTQAGLNTTIPSTPPLTADNPTIRNTTLTQDQGPWAHRRHNLSSYTGSLLSLRFRLDRMGTDSTDANSSNQFRISWWLVNITVANAG